MIAEKNAQEVNTHAILYHRYGSPDVLEYTNIEKPLPGADEVLIRVRAASVNPYDWHFLRGTPTFIRLFTGVGKPKSPLLGADVAGIVEATGLSGNALQARRCGLWNLQRRFCRIRLRS